jgi:hypothetical protein
MQRIYLENLTLSNDTLKIADVGLINQFLKVLRLRV